MNHFEDIKLLKILRNEEKVSKHVPITHFNSPTVLETQNGMVMSVIKVKGVPFDTEQNQVLNDYKRCWHRLLTSLDERFCIYTTIHRHKEPISLTGEFSNKFAKEVDAAYQERYRNQAMYLNDIYITIIFKGLTTGKVGKWNTVFKKISDHGIKEARSIRRKSQIKQLNDTVSQFMTSLSHFSPRLLGEKDTELGYSELLSFFSLFVNAGESLHFKGMLACPPIESTLKKAKKSYFIYPEGNLAGYITAKQIFCGEYIQYQGSQKDDTTYAALVTIKRYGTETGSVMLDPLLHLDCEFISTNSFAIESKALADKRIKRHAVKLKNANDPAESQTDELTIARDMIAGDAITAGYHHNTLMLFAKTKAKLEVEITNAIKCYMRANMIAVRETLGQEPAFWAQIPGNIKYIARSSLITSQNYVDFCPLHNYRTGFKDGNHLGSAVTIIETLSRTPLYLNLHSRGAKDNPSPGHTTLIGGNGSGKTVMMCFLDVELNRYGGRTFMFDRNRGMEIYIRACGGYYGILSPDHADEISFNPFLLEDTRNNRKFCRELMVQMVRKEDEKEVDAEVISHLSFCVNYAFEKLARKYRTLSNVVKALPVDFTRWHEMRRWLKAHDEHPEGEYAYLFDNEKDALEMHKKMGFDMTHFLDREPPNILAAVTMYLLYRLDLSLDGTLVSLYLDEGWQYLNNPYWQKRLEEWWPTLRKMNCHIIFATQSPQSVIKSAVSHTIMDNCATNIYFSNPQAKREHYVDGFNLTESEFGCIKANEPQDRIFLYKQGHESALGTLNLSHMKDYLAVFSGTQATVSLLDKIRKEVGDDPEKWLPIFYERRRQL